MLGAALANNFGLGMILSWKTIGEHNVKRAERNLAGLHRQSMLTAHQVDRDTAKMGTAMAGLQSKMKFGLGMMAAGGGILAALWGPVREAAEMEQGLANIGTLLVATGNSADQVEKSLNAIKKSVHDVGRSSRAPLRDLTESMYSLVSANLSVGEAQGALRAVSWLSAGGRGTVAEATDAMTSSLNTFGRAWGTTMTPVEKASKIANSLVGVIGALKTTLPEISGAMSYTSGAASKLGISLGETAASIGLLQTKGIGGSRAGSTLNAFLRTIMQISSGQRSLDPLLQGLDLVDKKTNQYKSIVEIIAEIERKLGVEASDGLVDVALSAKQAAALMVTFGDEGAQALMQLVGQSKLLQKQVAMAESGANAAAVAFTQQNTQLGVWAMTKNAVGGLAGELGAHLLPALKQITRGFAILVNALTKLFETFPWLGKFIMYGLASTAAFLLLKGAMMSFGPVLGMLKIGFTFLMTKLSLTGLAAAYASGGFWALAASIWAALWPVLALVAGVSLLVWGLSKISGLDPLESIMPDSLNPGGLSMSIDPTVAALTAGASGGTAQVAGMSSEDNYTPGRTAQVVNQTVYNNTFNGVKDAEGGIKEQKRKEKVRQRASAGGRY